MRLARNVLVFLYSILGSLTANCQTSQTAEGYWDRGRERYERGDTDGSIADFNKAIELSPSFSAAYTARAAARRRKGDLNAALTDCLKAIELDPKDPIAYSTCGYVRSETGDLSEAVTYFTKSIELAPDSAPDYYNRGRMYKSLGKYRQSIEDYAAAIRLDPQLSWAYNNLAWLLATCPQREFRDGKKAVELAKKACELTGWQDPDTLGTLAAAYAEAGDFDEAVRWQNKALEFPEYGKEEGKASQRLRLYKERKPYRENKNQMTVPLQ